MVSVHLHWLSLFYLLGMVWSMGVQWAFASEFLQSRHPYWGVVVVVANVVLWPLMISLGLAASRIEAFREAVDVGREWWNGWDVQPVSPVTPAIPGRLRRDHLGASDGRTFYDLSGIHGHQVISDKLGDGFVFTCITHAEEDLQRMRLSTAIAVANGDLELSSCQSS